MLAGKRRILNCLVNKSIKELFSAKRSEFSAEFILSCCHCQNAQRCCHLSACRCHHHLIFIYIVSIFLVELHPASRSCHIFLWCFFHHSLGVQNLVRCLYDIFMFLFLFLISFLNGF